jgi:hypothetical protein
MGRQLQEIANRRDKLILLAEYERQSLSANYLWSSPALLITDCLLDTGRMIISRSLTFDHAEKFLFTKWPLASLKWTGRVMRMFLMVNRIRKTLLR